MMCAFQRTDECTMEYEAQLNVKHEKMRQQLNHLEAIQQNVVQLSHRLESNDSREKNVVGACGMVRQNANYHSLPLGSRLQSLTDHRAHLNDDQSIDEQHHNNMSSRQKFDTLTRKDGTNSGENIRADSSGNPSDENNVLSSVTSVCQVSSSCALPTVNGAQKSRETIQNNGINHSENLRNTSHRMFALQQAGVYQYKQSVTSFSPATVDHDIPSSSSSAKLASSAVESVHMSTVLTVNEPPKLEQALHSEDSVSPSSQHQMHEHGSVVTSTCLNRPSVTSHIRSEPILLPDVIGNMSGNVTLQSSVDGNSVSCSSSTDTVSTLSASVRAASKIPPPVAQKPKFRYPLSSSCGTTTSGGGALDARRIAITTTSHGSADTVLVDSENASTGNIEMPSSKRSAVSEDLPPAEPELKKILDECPVSRSDHDEGQDLAESCRPVFKPSVTCPVRRRLPAGEELEISSTCPSANVQGKEDTASVAEDSAVCPEGNISKVQTVKNKLRAGMLRKVQFEPLALLLDAALEGEMDLLQTTLKV